MSRLPVKIKFLKKKSSFINKKIFDYSKKKEIKNHLEKKIPFSVTDFRNSIKIDINKAADDDLVINILGLDLSFANGIRRCLLSEVTSICIDKVFFYHNSSVLNDEVLSHRIGLIPLSFAHDLLDFFFNIKNDSNKKIIIELDVEHAVNKLKKISIYSKFLKFKSYGIQYSWLKNFQIQPVFKDILIAKLNPGQKIKCECHCKIGSGEIHAKFSPVGTAFYRIFPRIKLIEEILNEHADKVIKKCPVNVFQIENICKGLHWKLLVSKPKYCTLCRECIQPESEKKKDIRLGRVRNKITFIVESTGILSPEKLFHRAICLLTGKCNQSMITLLKNFGNKQYIK